MRAARFCRSDLIAQCAGALGSFLFFFSCLTCLEGQRPNRIWWWERFICLLGFFPPTFASSEQPKAVSMTVLTLLFFQNIKFIIPYFDQVQLRFAGVFIDWCETNCNSHKILSPGSFVFLFDYYLKMNLSPPPSNHNALFALYLLKVNSSC